MSGPRVAAAVFAKDLLLDLRSKDRIGHMAMFAALIVVLLSIALPLDEAARRAWIPTLIWVVFLFASLLGLQRSFQAEVEDGAVALLIGVPCDRGWVFLGKAAANLIALFSIQLLVSLLFAFFLDVEWGAAWAPLLGIAALGAIGLTTTGSLLSAMSMAVRFREFLLPILLFPLALPVLVFASQMTSDALAGDPIGAGSWGALALYDWVFCLIGYFVFDFLLED